MCVFLRFVLSLLSHMPLPCTYDVGCVHVRGFCFCRTPGRVFGIYARIYARLFFLVILAGSGVRFSFLCMSHLRCVYVAYDLACFRLFVMHM